MPVSGNKDITVGFNSGQGDPFLCLRHGVNMVPVLKES